MSKETLREQSFWSRVDKTDGCWYWTGSITPHGYGQLSVDYRMWRAHRLAWTLTNGGLDATDVLDHQCHNIDPTCLGGDGCMHRRCVNPDHLRVTTSADNTMASPHTLTAKNAKKTECPKGHAYLPDNQLFYNGRRSCKKCNNDRKIYKDPAVPRGKREWKHKDCSMTFGNRKAMSDHWREAHLQRYIGGEFDGTK